MKKIDIVKSLREDEKDGYGEILEITKEGVNYYDYDHDETFYRSEKYCTIDWLISKIFVGETAKKRGVDERTIANMLKMAYGEEFKDAICTLRGIVVFTNKNDFKKGIRMICPNDDLDELLEEFEYEDFDHVCGKLWHRKQIVFVNEKCISKFAVVDCDEILGYVDIYSSGMYETLIHEVRHCMLDTNQFLSEEQYPVYLAAEDEVEEFCRYKYDMLPKKYRIIDIPQEMIPKKVKYA